MGNSSRAYLFGGQSLSLNPHQILGSNLALWLQADLGIVVAPGSPVTSWPDQAANGNAVQSTNPDAPVLMPNSFGTRPGVACQTVDAGLVATLATQFAIGKRPYLWSRSRLTQLVHTVGAFQPLAVIATPPGFVNYLNFSGYASQPPADAFWDWSTATPALVDTFIELAELDLLPHTIQAATRQAGAIVFDGVVVDAPGAIAALSAPCDTVYLSNNQPAGGPPSTAGFWNIGVLVMAFDQPTPEEIAAVAAYCNAYR